MRNAEYVVQMRKDSAEFRRVGRYGYMGTSVLASNPSTHQLDGQLSVNLSTRQLDGQLSVNLSTCQVDGQFSVN